MTAVLLAVTGAATGYTAHVGDQRAADRLGRDADVAVGAIQQRLVAYGEVLVAVRGLFEAEPHPSRTRFRDFMRSMQVEARYPGVKVVTVAEAIEPFERARVRRQVRRDAARSGSAYPGFSVHPPRKAADHVAVTYLEPVDGNEPAFGFDLLSEARRADAVARTQRTGRPAATAPLRLVQDPKGRPAFLVMLAVRDVGGPLDSVRTGRFQGVVSAAFDSEELLSDALVGERAVDAELEVYDVGASRAGPTRQPALTDLAYDSDGTPSAVEGVEPGRALLRHLDVSGRRWAVYYARSMPADDTTPLAVGVGGALVSLLTGWLVLTLARGRSHALVLAGRMTRDLEASREQLVRANSGLRASEERVRQIVDSATDAFVSIGTDGRVVDWNPAAELTFGWPRAEAVGRLLTETIIPERYCAAHAEGLAQFLETGETRVLGQRLELTALHRDGHELEVELAISLVQTVAGAVFHAFLHDIGERKRAQREIEHSRRLLAKAQQIASLGSWEWDVVGDEVRWSPEMHQIFGTAGEGFDPSYAAFLERVHPDDRERIDQLVRAALAARAPFTCDHRVVRPDGGMRIVEGSGEMVTDAAGNPVRVVGTCQDVTERKLADEALRKAEERFRSAFESAPIGMALTALDGHYLQVNDALCEITGYRREELEEITFWDITHPDHVQSDREQMRLLLAGEVPVYKTEKRYLGRGGREPWVAVLSTVIRDSEGKPSHLLAQIQDVSDRRRLEGELRKLAQSDPLTGLPNRRAFEDALSGHLARARRYGADGALLLLDLDRFKAVNDEHGHLTGDKVLVAAATALRGRVRETDTVARLGGDEFAVLLPKASPADACGVAQALVTEIAAATAADVGMAVTASVGLAAVEDATELTAEALMARADRAMYDAKATGRDRVTAHGPA